LSDELRVANLERAPRPQSLWLWRGALSRRADCPFMSVRVRRIRFPIVTASRATVLSASRGRGRQPSNTIERGCRERARLGPASVGSSIRRVRLRRLGYGQRTGTNGQQRSEL